MLGETYVCDTSHTNTLKLATVKLFHCGFEVRSSFELNKASDLLAKSFIDRRGDADPLPSRSRPVSE